MFLQLHQFKALGRQQARVQHMKITDPTAVKLLPPGVYRARWDALLKALEIPSRSRLTPECLRAGAALCAYRAGRPINDILWLTRLRNQQTLESYLQEVAATTALRSLPGNVRSRLLQLATLFEHL